MEVLNARSALLSNYEVLTLLKELESDQLARTKTAFRIKKEEEQAGTSDDRVHHHIVEEVSENLRTVEFEAIQYLKADYQPTHSQNEASITQLIKDLAPYGFTKAEKLQIVNLAPTKPVELYVVIEELEDRIGDQMDEVLEYVKCSLSDRPADAGEPTQVSNGSESVYTYATNPSRTNRRLDDWDYEVNEDSYDDTGEGAGVEGDLEMEEE